MNMRMTLRKAKIARARHHKLRALGVENTRTHPAYITRKGEMF